MREISQNIKPTVNAEILLNCNDLFYFIFSKYLEEKKAKLIIWAKATKF